MANQRPPRIASDELDLDNFSLALGIVVKNLREKAGYTQREIAEELDVTVTHISGIETGARGLSVPLLLELAQALQITPSSLLRKTENELQD